MWNNHIHIWRLLLGVSIGVAIGFLTGRQKRTYSIWYLAEEGAAWYLFSIGDESNATQKTLIFDEARGFKESETEVYEDDGPFHDPVYKSFDYDYTWVGVDGATIFRISDSIEATESKDHNINYLFALAVFRQFTEKSFDRLTNSYNEHGFVEFLINGKDKIRIFNNYLEFAFGKRLERVTDSEITVLNIEGGVFNIKTSNAKLFSNSGKYQFRYKEIENGWLFVPCLTEIAGFELR